MILGHVSGSLEEALQQIHSMTVFKICVIFVSILNLVTQVHLSTHDETYLELSLAADDVHGGTTEHVGGAHKHGVSNLHIKNACVNQKGICIHMYVKMSDVIRADAVFVTHNIYIYI